MINRKIKAAMVIEASFVFPIVFIVIAFLIISSVFVSQRIILESKMQKIALIISKEKEFKDIHQAYLNNTIFGYKVDASKVVESYKNINLYAFLKGDSLSQSAYEPAKNDLQQSLLGSTVKLNSIEEKGNIFQKFIEIKVEYRFNPIRVFSYINDGLIEPALKGEVITSVPILGGTGFVRNIDTAKSVVKYFFNGKGEGKKIDQPLGKLKEYLKSLTGGEGGEK